MHKFLLNSNNLLVISTWVNAFIFHLIWHWHMIFLRTNQLVHFNFHNWETLELLTACLCPLIDSSLTISLVFVAGLCSLWSSTCRRSESWSSGPRPRRRSGTGFMRLQRWQRHTCTHTQTHTPNMQSGEDSLAEWAPVRTFYLCNLASPCNRWWNLWLRSSIHPSICITALPHFPLSLW